MSRLYPIAVGPDRKRGSVIFVHGLGGHSFDTWGGSTDISRREIIPHEMFWPKWLADECTDLAFYVLGYVAKSIEITGSSMSLERDQLR